MRIENWRRIEGLLLVALLVCASSRLQGDDVRTAWDKNADFSKYRTYTWADRPTPTRPLMAIEIRADVDEQLKMKGLTIDQKHPDLILNFYGSTDFVDSVPAPDPTYTASGGEPMAGHTMWTNSSIGTVASVPKGTLVIEARDASTKYSVWRGIAKGTLKEKSSEFQKQIQSAIARMFQDFPPSKSTR